MQVGDRSSLFKVLVIARTARGEVKSVLMFSDRVFRTIIRMPKQGKAGLAIPKLLAIVTGSSGESVGNWRGQRWG